MLAKVANEAPSFTHAHGARRAARAGAVGFQRRRCAPLFSAPGKKHPALLHVSQCRGAGHRALSGALWGPATSHLTPVLAPLSRFFLHKLRNEQRGATRGGVQRAPGLHGAHAGGGRPAHRRGASRRMCGLPLTGTAAGRQARSPRRCGWPRLRPHPPASGPHGGVWPGCWALPPTLLSMGGGRRTLPRFLVSPAGREKLAPPP